MKKITEKKIGVGSSRITSHELLQNLILGSRRHLASRDGENERFSGSGAGFTLLELLVVIIVMMN